MRTQHAGEHPSDRLLHGPVRDFEQALELVEEELSYERWTLARSERAPGVMEAMDGAHEQTRAALGHAGKVYREEMEAARLRTAARLREDALAAEAALDDEASRWLGLLAEALERGGYAGLAI